MRGGLERWKRGVESAGVRQALAYAFKGTCDSHLRSVSGVEALADYSDIRDALVARFIVAAGMIQVDALGEQELRRWVDGHDPFTDEPRGRELRSPQADLVLDGTINAPKSFSIAALIHPELAAEFEELQDRLRDRVIRTWQRELNARRGAGGRYRESIQRLEVVELRHRRSRALDPHTHRHLWLNVKVLGEDGKWSNVDSRVAMRLHTVINAEGDLAARTDPVWLAALARHGYTLNADGEIAELTHLVRPLSRRSSQIEANRARLLADWRQRHPGQEPSRDVLQSIDRMAWASGRPNKPTAVNEHEWEELVRAELIAIDSDVLHPRVALPVRATAIVDVDRDLMAARAIVDADVRAASSSGRFGAYDVRAGAMRAIAASGISAQREQLQELIDDVTDRAQAHLINFLADDADVPAHVKGYMASSTAALKVELAQKFAAITRPGKPAGREHVIRAAAGSVGAVSVDEGQVDAAGAIAGTDRLVSVTGPAGSGKTTMLRIARDLLALQRRRMVVVAPTRKAASVAGREIDTTATSLHALLADHGWRWTKDAAGAELWTRLKPGQRDHTTGFLFEGPRKFPLGAGDRVVVDEAGMVDLHAANALATVVAETGAGLAMVGDELQAMPVGHSGAMACMTRRATAVVELSAVHRFRDSEYAALTLRMRAPSSREDAHDVAAQLQARGQLRRVTDAIEARAVMVEAYFHWSAAGHRIALVTSTNEEADAVNHAIQQRRIDHGDLKLRRIAVGHDDQRILEGDVVQTRRNDTAAGVENRAIWRVQRIERDAIRLMSISDPADVRVVSAEYAADHLHLAYASTVHGIQGETTTASLVGPGVDASGLYVGMTRGRVHNEALVTPRPDQTVVDAVADNLLRGAPEVTLAESIIAARSELRRAARTPHSVDGASRLHDMRHAMDTMAEWGRTGDGGGQETGPAAHPRAAVGRASGMMR